MKLFVSIKEQEANAIFESIVTEHPTKYGNGKAMTILRNGMPFEMLDCRYLSEAFDEKKIFKDYIKNYYIGNLCDIYEFGIYNDIEITNYNRRNLLYKYYRSKYNGEFLFYVYGRNWHRQRVSFNKSIGYDSYNMSWFVENSDIRKTNDYTIIRVFTNEDINYVIAFINGQLYDGVFENSNFGRVKMIAYFKTENGLVTYQRMLY